MYGSILKIPVQLTGAIKQPDLLVLIMVLQALKNANQAEGVLCLTDPLLDIPPDKGLEGLLDI